MEREIFDVLIKNTDILIDFTHIKFYMIKKSGLYNNQKNLGPSHSFLTVEIQFSFRLTLRRLACLIELLRENLCKKRRD